MPQEQIVSELEAMLANPDLITESGFRVNTELWPDHRIPFVKDHVDYLANHRTVKPEHYLTNLRLQLRRR